MIKPKHGACYIKASIPSSLGRRFERILSCYPDLSPSQFFISVLSRGLDELYADHLGSTSERGDEE